MSAAPINVLLACANPLGTSRLLLDSEIRTVLEAIELSQERDHIHVTLFEVEAEKSFPYWIRLATTREVVRPLKQLSNVLPDMVERHVYSDEVMFGSTLFKEALDKAAIRFIDKKYAQHEKLFVVISDGNFGEENAFIVSINLLKRRGVTILSCLISEKNILSHLVKKPMKDWPLGARLMVEMASKASEGQNAKFLGTVD